MADALEAGPVRNSGGGHYNHGTNYHGTKKEIKCHVSFFSFSISYRYLFIPSSSSLQLSFGRRCFRRRMQRKLNRPNNWQVLLTHPLDQWMIWSPNLRPRLLLVLFLDLDGFGFVSIMLVTNWKSLGESKNTFVPLAYLRVDEYCDSKYILL